MCPLSFYNQDGSIGEITLPGGFKSFQSEWFTSSNPGDFSISNTPIPLSSGYSVTFDNGDMHTFLYYNGSSYSSSLYKYDASTGTWSNTFISRVSSGTFKNPVCSFIRNGELHYHQVGDTFNADRIHKINSDDVDSVVYDSQQAGQIAQYGVSFYDDVNDVLYWGGGLDGGSRRRTLYSYDFESGNLIKFPSFPRESLYGGVIVKVGDYIYATPGAQTNPVKKLYRININNPSGSWESLADPPYTPSNTDDGWEFNGNLYTINFYENDTSTFRVHIYKYNVDENTWELWDNSFETETGYNPTTGGGRFFRKSDATLWLVGGYDRVLGTETDRVSVWKQGSKNIIE